MIITYSKHAEQTIKERKLTKRLIKQVVQKPDTTLPTSHKTEIAQKKVQWHGKKVLCRVVYRKTSREAARIITAYITTKVTKYQG